MTGLDRRIHDDRTERAFDRALLSAARTLVLEPLPTDVLAAPRPVGTRPWRRTLAPLAVAATLLVLIASAIGAPRLFRAEPDPAFRSGNEISQDLRNAGFSCRAGTAAPLGQPRMEAIVCTATTPSILATVVVSEDPTGRVAEVHLDSDTLGRATATTDRDRSNLLEATIGLPFDDPADAAAARAWLIGQLPLDPGERVGTTIGSTPVVLERGDGEHRFVLGDLGGGLPAAPSP